MLRTRSRAWVEEEGEIFRKGQALLGPEELEGEFAGEELRIEVKYHNDVCDGIVQHVSS